MTYSTLTFPEWTQNWVNEWAAGVSTPERTIVPNLQDGSYALATAKASANQATVLQFMAQTITEFARASTCVGPDLDSWMAQFAFYRLQSQYGIGLATFSSNVILTQPAFIPVGTIIQTPGAAIQYVVIADNSLPTYNASTQSYQIPAGQSATNCRVQAAIPGSSYNVQAGQLSQLQSTLYGISTVINALPINSGSNAEKDPAFRARFIKFINGLSKATEDALNEAISGIQTGLKIKMLEQVIAVGNPPTSFITALQNQIAYGNTVYLVDDGSGAPSQALLNQVIASVENTIAYGVRYQVLQPAIVSPSLSMICKFYDGAVIATELANITLQIYDYIKTLPIGGDNGFLDLSQIIRQAYLGSPVYLESVVPNSTLINGVADNFAMEPFQEAVVAINQINVTSV